MISGTPTDVTIAAGETALFAATGTYTDGTTADVSALVIWSSDAPAVCTVGSTAGTFGLATGVAAGSTTIRVNHVDSGVQASAAITVTAAELVSIEVNAPASLLSLGGLLFCTATGTYTDGSTELITADVTWSSSNPLIASISNALGFEGQALALLLGSTTITATHPATALVDSFTLTVTF